MTRDTVIFDLGGVLIDWDPRHLYRKLFAGDDAAMAHFLANVCTPQWHVQHDGGTPFAQSRGALKQAHPQFSDLIDAWGDRYQEMFAGPIKDSVAILERLATRGVPLYALTNWSHETFPWARRQYPFLAHFRDVGISGVERILKPDPRLYRILLERNRIDPECAVYVDDNLKNVDAARALGMYGVHFTDARMLEGELTALELLDPPA